MKQKQFGFWACAVLFATAASPVFAGTWEPAPAALGYTPNYNAVSCGTATASAPSSQQDVYGSPIDSDGTTTVKFKWTTDDPRVDPAPNYPTATFLWNYSGDVSQVVTNNGGYGSARLYLSPYNSYAQQLRVLTISGTQVQESSPVPANPQPTSQTCSTGPVQTDSTGSYVIVSFYQQVATRAVVYGGNYSGTQASASATSAAATLGVVNDSITVASQ